MSISADYSVSSIGQWRISFALNYTQHHKTASSPLPVCFLTVAYCFRYRYSISSTLSAEGTSSPYYKAITKNFSITGNTPVHFFDNSAASSATVNPKGSKAVNLKDNDTLLFTNNTATGSAGLLTFSGNGEQEFHGNTTDTSTAGIKANSIRLSNESTLIAQAENSSARISISSTTGGAANICAVDVTDSALALHSGDTTATRGSNNIVQGALSHLHDFPYPPSPVKW